MRIFALSDIHVDYDANARWVSDVSASDYLDDVLVLAGDVSDSLRLLEWCLTTLAARFKKVLFVPGNHDLWVIREPRGRTSLQKFLDVIAVVTSSGASMQPFRGRNVAVVPLLGWYDDSFGAPSEALKSVWMDYHACRWPAGFGGNQIAAYFAALNDQYLMPIDGDVITFSHFLPRIDVMPSFVSEKWLYPILGTARIEQQLRRLKPIIHLYGHSHINRKITLDGITYLNNAFAYPHETRIAAKRLLCIHGDRSTA
jgi:predicted phosphodiesterase